MLKKIIFLLIVAIPIGASAQNAVDLGDVSVTGDLLNDNRLRINSREPASIDDRVKYRRDYRKEILEDYSVTGGTGGSASTASTAPEK